MYLICHYSSAAFFRTTKTNFYYTEQHLKVSETTKFLSRVCCLWIDETAESVCWFFLLLFFTENALILILFYFFCGG